MDDSGKGNTGMGGDGKSTRADAAERMRRAVNLAVSGTGSTSELQAAARALVEELRRTNESPEQVLLQIKDFLAEAGLRPTYAKDASTIYRDVITWTIRAYYDERRETRDER